MPAWMQRLPMPSWCSPYSASVRRSRWMIYRRCLRRREGCLRSLRCDPPCTMPHACIHIRTCIDVHRKSGGAIVGATSPGVADALFFGPVHALYSQEGNLKLGSWQMVLWQPRWVHAEVDALCYQKITAEQSSVGVSAATGAGELKSESAATSANSSAASQGAALATPAAERHEEYQ